MKRMMKRWGVALGVFTLSAGMLSGCGRVTPDGLLKQAMANASKASSYTGNLNMNMTMGIKQDGVSMDFEVGMDMDMEATKKPGEYHMDGTLDLGIMNMSLDMEMYGKENKDGSKLITYTNVNNKWTKSETEKDDAPSAADLMDLEDLLDENAELMLQKKLEKENGRDVFVITTTVTGDKLEAAEELLGGMSESDIEDLDMSTLKGNVVIKVDKEKCLPASISIDFADSLGDGASIKSDGVEMTLNNLNMMITYDEYDTIDKINLPKDAIDAEEVSSDSNDILDSLSGSDTYGDTNDEISTDGDGNYIIRDYDNKKEIALPPLKGMELDEYSDSHSATFYMEGENYNSIAVFYSVEQMNEYSTEEDLAKYLQGEKEYYATDSDYKDIVFEDVKTVKAGKHEVKYTSLSYAFSDTLFNKIYYAWFITDDGFAVTCNMRESGSDAKSGYLNEKKIIEAMADIQE